MGIGKPAKKVISKELKTRYDAIDFEFKENQIAAITNHLGASMEMLPGAATLTTDLSTLEARLRPYLTATTLKAKVLYLKIQLVIHLKMLSVVQLIHNKSKIIFLKLLLL